MTDSSADVAVIGGGIMGLASAYHLAQAGVETVLIERASGVGYEASGVNSGGVRQHGRAPEELPLALAAIAIWAGLADELEEDIEYLQSGHLRLATTESEFDTLVASVERQREAGLRDLEILSASEVDDLGLPLTGEFAGGSFCQSDGHANPGRTCEAFGRAAVRAGVRILVDTEVRGIDVDPTDGFAVHTSDGTVRTRYVVNAAGAWSGAIAALAGVELPVRVHFWQCLATEPLSPRYMPVVTWPAGDPHRGPTRNLNVKQNHVGEFVISGAWTGTGALGSGRREATPEGIFGSARDFSLLFRSPPNVHLRSAWVGVEGHVPDDLVCIGPAPEVPGFFFAGPGCGHSFALGPIVGKLIAECITTGEPSIPTDAFSVGRFAQVTSNPVVETSSAEA